MSASRNAEEVDPRERFGLYALCPCSVCDSTGRLKDKRCPECRGEMRARVELATCATAEGVGVALVTLAREGEWKDADGHPCAFGLLDRMGEKGKQWLILPWSAYTPRHISEAGRTLARSKRSDRQ